MFENIDISVNIEDVKACRYSNIKLEILIYEIFHMIKDSYNMTLDLFKDLLRDFTFISMVIQYRLGFLCCANDKEYKESIFYTFFTKRERCTLAQLSYIYGRMKDEYSLCFIFDYLFVYILLWMKISISQNLKVDGKSYYLGSLHEKQGIATMFFGTLQTISLFLNSKLKHCNGEEVQYVRDTGVDLLNDIKADMDMVQHTRGCKCKHCHRNVKFK